MKFNLILIQRYSKPLIFCFTEYKLSKIYYSEYIFRSIDYNFKLKTIGLIQFAVCLKISYFSDIKIQQITK